MKSNPKDVPIPAWYELDTKGTATLVIRIHVVAMVYLKSICFGEAPIVKHYLTTHNLAPFIGPAEARWGFGGVLVQAKLADPNWLAYECALPILHDGKKSEYDSVSKQQEVYGLRSTLSVLFQALWLFDGNTQHHLPQLIVIEGMLVIPDMHGGGIGATLTPAMATWLSKQPDNSCLKDVESAMKRADAHMWRNRAFPAGERFHAWCRQPKWINISIPGDACGLDPEDYYDESPDHGYGLVPHNADSSLQQFTFFMGLAKLHSLVRKNHVP